MANAPKEKPFRGFFRDIGIDRQGVHENLAHYEFAEESWAAFLYCLDMRGGIEKMDRHCGSESFTLADNVNAAVTGKPPTAYRSLQSIQARVPSLIVPFVRQSLTEAAAFPVDDSLEGLMLDIRVCYQEIEEYVIRVKKLGDTHRLMSLRRDGGSGDSAEDVCQAVVLVFTLGVTFPLPRAEPLPNAATDLERIMSSSSSISNAIQNTVSYSGPQCWARSRQGQGEAPAAAVDEGVEIAKRYRLFFDKTRRRRAEPGLTIWHAAKAMLKTFFWLGSACDAGAWKVWTQSLQLTQAATSK
ncbi:hypothetical protein PG993_002908 [Apiospora rasikravindrae]|uniref:Uncharacterized protein n=1 Tax=Apiospora rasikravindrae TaxID=990691 RepID=A0ABR1TXZ3_9PEZI